MRRLAVRLVVAWSVDAFLAADRVVRGIACGVCGTRCRTGSGLAVHRWCDHGDLPECDR